MSALTGTLQEQIDRRRTFAIISHPDAGKTTLTEKLLLYSNAIHLAGNVRARRNQRNTTSDWMAIERERGISITSTVLQFPYAGHIINLLDTPGHADFSEDTYRTLAATDSAVMVLDAAKGIESQTRKLFEVCRQRGVPIFTFINKLDRPSQDPLDLLDEIEKVLEMEAVPMNWPIGDGPNFRGIYDRSTRTVHLFDRTIHNQSISPETAFELDDERLANELSAKQRDELLSSVELLDGLGIDFDHEFTLAGEQTPVFFGSALTNFGVQLFMNSFVEFAPPPGSFATDNGVVSPEQEDFSGFVFKIQANMNPRHRDSVAFLRICSGRFDRNMAVTHAQTGKTIRLPRPYKFFAEEREVLEEAFPGDIIGLPSNGNFAIGDTLCADANFRFTPIPRFEPELYARLINTDVGKQKQFLKGLRQLETEGAMQVLYESDAMQRHPVLAVVGQLQFDVVRSRLETEYRVETTIEPLPFKLVRLLEGPSDELERLPWGYGLTRARDSSEREVALFRSQYDLDHCRENYPDVTFAPYG